MTIVLLASVFSGNYHDAGESFSPGVLVVSAAKSQTQEQIDKAEKEKKELEKQQDKNEDKLNDLKAQQKGLKNELNNLNSQLMEVAANLDALDTQIRDKEQEIFEAQIALADAISIENQQHDYMVTKVRYMYENKENGYLGALFKETNFSDMLNTADYVEKVAAYDRKVMDSYIENRVAIEELGAKLRDEKAELDGLKEQAEAEKARVNAMIEKTRNSISSYASAISEAEQKALEYEEEIRKAEADLKTLKKKLAEELALSQAAANATWRTIGDVTFTEADRKLLANIIYCEAGSEPYAGKLAVGSVVINRVLSSKFPDSVTGVVYQKNQFTPAKSGRLELALASDKATQSCYQAADEAMQGMTNVGTCVYFRRPVSGLTGITIGNHIFY